MTEERLLRLETHQRIATSLLCLLVLVLVGVSGYLAYRLHGLETATSLRVKELRIYDDKGVDRVVIAGALPDPFI